MKCNVLYEFGTVLLMTYILTYWHLDHRRLQPCWASPVPHNMSGLRRKGLKRETFCLIVGPVLAMFGTIGVLVTMFTTWWKKKIYVGIVHSMYSCGIWFFCSEINDHYSRCQTTALIRSSPALLQASRVLLCVSLVCVLSAWVPLILGLKRFLHCGQRRIPLITAGCMLVTAAIAALIPVTLISVHPSQAFPFVSYEYGSLVSPGLGLYVGWVDSGLLVGAGVILLVSSTPCMMSRQSKITEEASEGACIMYNALEDTDSIQLSMTQDRIVWVLVNIALSAPQTFTFPPKSVSFFYFNTI